MKIKKYDSVNGWVQKYPEVNVGAIVVSNPNDASSSTFLRGDGTWSTVEASGNQFVNITGDTMTGELNLPSYVIDTDFYHTWTKKYVVNTTTPATLLYKDGNALPNGGVYRFTAHIAGTGTDNMAQAVFWNANGTWKVNVTGQSGTSSNHPEFIVSGGVPKLITDHSSNYTISVLGERMELEEGTGTDNAQFAFGAGSYLSSVGGVLRYNSGGGSDYTAGSTLATESYADTKVSKSGDTMTGKLDIQQGNGFALITGADVNASTLTNNSRKYTRIGMPHYTNTEDPFSLITGDSDGTNNIVHIGGGTSAGNAATQISLKTSANTTTTYGTTRMHIASDGNVGIGTTNPSSPLTVAGTIESLAASSSEGGDLRLRAAIGNSYRYTIDNYSDTLRFVRQDDSTGSNGTVRMLIDSSGKVGIGTATPNSKLHILDANPILVIQDTETSGASSDARLRLAESTTGNVIDQYWDIKKEGTNLKFTEKYGTNIYDRLTISGANGNATFANDLTVQGDLFVSGSFTTIDTDTTTTEQWSVTNDGTGPAVIINQKGQQPVIDIQDDGTSVFYIADGGNVGIGTTTPLTTGGDHLLTLNASGTKGMIMGASNNDALYIRRIGAVGEYQLQTKNASGNAGEIHLQPYGGNVGIGTTNPSERLEVIGNFKIKQGSGYSNYGLIDQTEAKMDIKTYSSNTGVHAADITFQPNLTERMRITDDGNVGIGTTSPDEKLDVNGNVRLSGDSRRIDLARGTTSSQPKIIVGEQGTYGLQLRWDSGSRAHFDRFWSTSIDGTPSGQMMTFDINNDRIGIGTTSPARKLDVAGSSRFRDTIYLGASDDQGVISWNSNGAVVRGQSGKGLSLGANAVNDHMYINTSGKVGIGTTSPEYNLDVEGDFRVKATYDFAIRQLSISSSSYDRRVITLVPKSTTNTGQTRAVYGEFTLGKKGGNIFDPFKLGVQSVYNNTRGFIQENGTNKTGHKFVEFDYNSVRWIGVELAYEANPYNYCMFYGTAETDTAADDQLKVLSYYDENGGGVLNSEIYNSLADFSVSNSSQTIYYNGHKVWHAGNDGTGSGLSADNLRGYLPQESASANSIAKRNGDGDLAVTDLAASGDVVITNILPKLKLVDSNNDSDFHIANNNGVLEIADTSNQEERFAITSAGNVGIGTTSPTEKLTVYGISTTSENSPVTYIKHNFTGTHGFGLSVSRDNSDIAALALGSNSSNHGIVVANNTDLVLSTISSGAINSGVTVKTSGNVGIGTTSPGYKLDVAGDVNVTGNFKINGTNLSTGGGTLDWAQLGSVTVPYSTSTTSMTISPSNGLDSIIAIEVQVFSNASPATWTGPLDALSASSTYKAGIWAGSTQYANFYRNSTGTSITFSGAPSANIYNARVYELKVV